MIDIITRVQVAAATMPYKPQIVYLGRGEVRLLVKALEELGWPANNINNGEVYFQGMRVLPVTVEHHLAFG